MTAAAPTIVATSMGFASRGRDRWDVAAGPVFDLAADLSGAVGTPKVCYLGTAAGDDAASMTAACSALSARFRAPQLEVFTMPNVEDVRGHLLARDCRHRAPRRTWWVHVTSGGFTPHLLDTAHEVFGGPSRCAVLIRRRPAA